ARGARLRGADGREGDGHRRGWRLRRRRTDRVALRALGGGRARLSAREVARRTARSRRPGHRRAGPLDPRASRGVRGRRSAGGAGVWGGAGGGGQGGRPAAGGERSTTARKAPPPFRYVDKGSLATIGRAAAIADFGRIKLSGFVAWIAWLLIHILLLIGFRNR